METETVSEILRTHSIMKFKQYKWTPVIGLQF